MSSISNEIFIVGGDHHNGLNLARILGMNGLTVNSIVVSDIKTRFISRSKYISSSRVFETDKEAYDYLLTLPEPSNKAFIIPYSDSAAYELDSRLDEFKYRYYVPSINEKQGIIADLMDKQKQYDFAKSVGIKMAYTVTVNMDSFDLAQLEEIPLPCIIKPVISAEGDKRDITICETIEELVKSINKYKGLNYRRALVQEYLTVDYEIDVFGCTLKQEPYICMVPTHTIRAWPPKGGTNSFSYIITDESILDNCKAIINKLRDYGFYGLYDIELLVVDGDIVLNEINYRNSGDVYMGIHQGYFYPYVWILDCLGLKIDIQEHPNKQEFTMTECADIRNVIVNNISFKQWLSDYKKSTDFALKLKGDMSPAINRYLYYIGQFIKGKRL